MPLTLKDPLRYFVLKCLNFPMRVDDLVHSYHKVVDDDIR